jgi:hypothetical protein
MRKSTDSIKNHLNRIGRLPKFLALVGASTLVLPIFSYAATAATVHPTAVLSQGVQGLAGARTSHVGHRLNVPVTTLVSKVGANGAILTSTHYSAALRNQTSHRRRTTTTSTVAPTTSSTVAPTTSTTVVASSTTSTTFAPSTTTTVAPTTTTTAARAPTTTLRPRPTTTTPRPRPTTTTTVAPTTTTTVAPPATTTVPASAYPIGNADSSEPSGYAPPSANALSNYSQTYVTDFGGSSVPSGWNIFTGQPGGDPGAQWGAAHVSVLGGLLSLNTYQDPSYNNEWVTGGLCQCGVAQTYGAYFVRSRVTGAGPTNVELLWPSASVWPPEIDFNETGGQTNGTSATVHSTSSNSQDQRTYSLDMTQWHTFGVIWTSTSITYTVDGNVWGTVTKASEVPQIGMTLDLTQQTWCKSGFACPTTPQSMQIDWVAEYSQN